MVQEEDEKVWRGETGVGEIWTVGVEGFVVDLDFIVDVEGSVDDDRAEVDVDGRAGGCASGLLELEFFFEVDEF
jgi:hypothetical protein